MKENTMVAHPLMPKATAIWLVDNTALSFEQIAEFCGLHILEVQGIADGEVAPGMVGLDPVTSGQITLEDIKKCEKNPQDRLRLAKNDLPEISQRVKGPRYTPISKRNSKPDAIAWLCREHPELSDAQICRLIGTTRPTVQAVRDRSHWNSNNLKPRNPALLGLCKFGDLETELAKAARRKEKIDSEKVRSENQAVYEE